MTRRKTLPVLFFVTCWMVGCSTSPPVAAAAPKAVVIVIRMAGGGAPSMQQAALVHKAIGPALTKSGLEVSPTLAGADYVITVTLTPDPANPMKAHMAVSKVEQNLQKPSSTLVDDARARLSEFQRWGESQSAPIYGP